MAQISVRKLDPNWDPLAGNGIGNFIYDLDAVGQIIATTIRLLYAEFWESLATGTPLFQKMLGVAGAGKKPGLISMILQQRIFGCPYVTGISNVVTAFDPNTREFQFSCRVQTQFGTVTVSTPTPGARAIV